MKDFFKGVRRRIGKLDAEHLREQYGRISDEMLLLENVLKSMKEAVIVLDGQGSVLYENKAATAILGMTAEDAVPALGVPLGVASKKELAITYPDEKCVEMQTVPMNDDTVVMLRDVTSERKRTEDEMRAGATQAVRDLAAGVAHEIGNPLNALSINLQLLKRSPEDAAEIVDECQAQIVRLDSILKGFLQALRPSKPCLAPGNVADPLTACLKAMKRQLEERRIAVTLDVQGPIPPAAIDKEQLEQVFFNLLKNAMEAIPEGGGVDVGLSSDDNDIVVTFADNGTGMDAERVAHLFEPYRTSKEHGTGLGLMISARIVRDHGGTISVESRLGEGTTFTIRLPRLERRIRALR